MDWCVVAAQATASDKDLFLAFGLDAVTIHNSNVSLAAWLEARLDATLGRRPEQGGYQGLPGNPQLQPGSTAVDAAVITRAVGQGVALGPRVSALSNPLREHTGIPWWGQGIKSG